MKLDFKYGVCLNALADYDFGNDDDDDDGISAGVSSSSSSNREEIGDDEYDGDKQATPISESLRSSEEAATPLYLDANEPIRVHKYNYMIAALQHKLDDVERDERKIDDFVDYIERIGGNDTDEDDDDGDADDDYENGYDSDDEADDQEGDEEQQRGQIIYKLILDRLLSPSSKFYF